MIIKKFPSKAAFREMAKKANTIPICTEILADTETPVSILKKLYKGEAPIFLLESVEGGERWGRYSFLGASARMSFRVFRNHVEIEEMGEHKRIEHNGAPLAVLRSLLNGYRAAEVQGLPRFWGGMVGYVTYEMASFFEKVPNLLPEDQPMAAFIIPDSLLVFDNIRHTLTVIGIAFTGFSEGTEKSYALAERRMEELLSVLEAPCRENEGIMPAFPCVLSPETERKDYIGMVEAAKRYIRSGEIIQGVLSRSFSCRYALPPVALYRAQRYINPSPYLYFLHLGDVILVGSSPETMVRLEDKVATLRPIAGTRPRGKTEQEDRAMADEILEDQKERAEHLMLVDLGRNDLGKVAVTGTVQVTELMIVERYSHVMHLVSNLRCDLRPEADAWDLLAATFPAGTLSGAPKKRAMQIIAELEKGPRGPYGGAVGYVSFHGNMDMAIVIRTSCIENKRLTVRSGAGIVADSDPEKELIETENKVKAIVKALEMAGGATIGGMQ